MFLTCYNNCKCSFNVLIFIVQCLNNITFLIKIELIAGAIIINIKIGRFNLAL